MAVQTNSNAGPRWKDPLFSQSVNTLLNTIDDHPDGGNLTTLMETLRELHPEYGRLNHPDDDPFQTLILTLQARPGSMNEYTGAEWVGKVHAITRAPRRFPDINGRMFLIAALLSEYPGMTGDPEWSEQARTLVSRLETELITLKRTDFQELLTDEGRKLRQLLDAPAEPPAWIDPDSLVNTRNLSDAPTRQDALSRKSLAHYLAKRLRFIYNQDVTNGQAFFMHIDGAWGSGKSTLLGFLQDALETKAPANPRIKAEQPSQGEWIVVNFNAWENQRLDPPWWFLLKALHRQAMRALWKRDFRRWLGVGLTERLWRLNPGGRNLQLSVVAFFIFLYARYFGVTSEKTLKELPLVQTLTFLLFIGSMAKTIGSMLLSGSARAAQAFVDENSSDPMNRLTRHFNKLITEIGYPVAIFIDDLDRCNKEYGVKLLEGLQTIYKNAPVVYVIAADRKWLSTMYESQYSLFAPAIMKPAKPFGLVFLDKIFQWIVELPEISAVQKKVYWDSLLNIGRPETEVEQQYIEQKIRTSGSLQDKLTVVDETDSPAARQFAREKVVESLSVQEEERLLEHKLQGFLGLIEPNPRAMKRLLNDISTAKAMSILYNQRIAEEQLVLWMILKQQYPDLARLIWEAPDILQAIQSRTGLPKAYEELLGKAEVTQLFEYGTGSQAVRLDADFIARMKFRKT